MGPVWKKRADKDSLRHNPYFRTSKNTKELPLDKKEHNLLKNTLGEVVTKLVSTFSWTYMSIFEKPEKHGVLIEPIVVKKRDSTAPFSSCNENNSRKRHPFPHIMNHKQAPTCYAKKSSPDSKTSEFLTRNSDPTSKGSQQKQQKDTAFVNNHIAFDYTQWPKNSSTGILTAWREICRQQQVLLKNNVTELQLCKSKSMFIKDNAPMKNTTANMHTKTLNMRADDTIFNNLEKRQKNIVQIPEKKKTFHNRFNDPKNSFEPYLYSPQVDNIENLKLLKENTKPRKISENFKLLNSTDAKNIEANHRQSKSCSFSTKNTKETIIQKEDSDQLINIGTEYLKTHVIEKKQILNCNTQKSKDFEGLEDKNNVKLSKNVDKLPEIKTQNYIFFANNQNKRKKSGYFSALEEDLEEMYGPYDIDDDTMFIKRKKHNEVDIGLKEPTNNLQKHTIPYQQPYFHPRVPLLKESKDTDTSNIQNLFNIDNLEKQNVSIFSSESKQILSDKDDHVSDPKLTFNNNNIHFSEKNKNNEELKTFQSNMDTKSLEINENNKNNKRFIDPDNSSVEKEKTSVNIINSFQHNNLNNISNIPFLSNHDKKDSPNEKKSNDFTSIQPSQSFIIDTSSQKSTEFLNKEIKSTSSFEFPVNDENKSKSQNVALSKKETSAFSFDTINKISDISQTNNDKYTNYSEKTETTFSTSANMLQESSDIENSQTLISNKPIADTVMDMDSPEKKETKSQSKIIDFNFTTPISNEKSLLLGFKNNESSFLNQKESSEKTSELQPHSTEQKILQSNEDSTKTTALEQSLSATKSSDFSNLTDNPFSFKLSTVEDNKSQSSPFSFLGPSNDFVSQKKHVQTNTTNEGQKNASSSNSSGFNVTEPDKSKSAPLELNQTSTTPFTFGQNSQSTNSMSNTTPTPIFSFGTMNQSEQGFSFNQQTSNTFPFQTTQSNPSVFQFGDDKNRTNTHEFTFNFNNIMSSGSSSLSQPYIFGQSTRNSSNQQTVPSFSFGTNTSTAGAYPQFQPQIQTINTGFSFGTSQNTSQESNTSNPNPFAFTFNTPQSPVPGRKIAAPKSRLRRR
ncbi:hypothetical protein PORY_002197 [Pneumocystis oryctolagi]|uniref:Uncharacterized protein n=1 Tax=Pneumocystis oryctolagi TaxID=42067 RepID=A0ACB7C9U4_9ASCO|nr:hypothetical protein PORY_002197 [Pneumocystis oryctolagi]